MNKWRHAGYGLVLGMGSAFGLSAVMSGGPAQLSALQATPANTALVIAPWRYGPTPDGDMNVTAQDFKTLAASYQMYRERWQTYNQRMQHCMALSLTPQVRALAGCRATDSTDACMRKTFVQCLQDVMQPFTDARYAVHDQAIQLEAAAQQLAAETQ